MLLIKVNIYAMKCVRILMKTGLPNQASLPGARTERGLLGLYPACLALEGTGFLSLVSC